MKTPRFQYSVTGARRFTRLLLSPVLALALLQGCTDLEENPTSVITPDNFFQTEQEILSSLASVYAVLRNATTEQYYNISNISSDETIAPTRGSDWFDNGRWLEIQRHTWTAVSPSGLDDINNIWNNAFRGVARANLLIVALEEQAVPAPEVIAELRTLRAYYYYQLLDMFGGVPIVTDAELGERAKNTRDEVFQFVTAELIAAYADLPATWPAANHGRMTKGAAAAILASTYLNAGVFTTETPSATSYNSCTSVTGACDAAVAWADSVLNSGVYSLATDWRSSFEPDNSASPENIFVVKFINEPGLGLNFVMRVLHYQQFTPSPWNGFAALADAYNAFDADDERREIFLEGSQVHLDTGDPVCERPGCASGGVPLVFTVDIVDPTQAGEGEGTRIIKWPPDANRVAQENGNDVAPFRLGEIYLIKAEALNELSPGSGQALALLNTLRERVFDPDEPLLAIDRDVILQERLFELINEGKRRMDLIRHGRYTAAWEHKAAGAPHLVLMPIPQTQLDANPLLTQNPGY
jgi:hypothetical protein